MRGTLSKVLAGAAVGATLFSPALAQSSSQDMPMRSMMGGGCPMMGMMGQNMMGGEQMGRGMMRRKHMGRGQMQGMHRMGAMVEGRLAYLKTELELKSPQEAAWESYADAVRGRVEVMKGMRHAMMTTMQNGNAIERMETRISGMEAMVEALKAVKPATEKLYAVLDEKQKKTADQLIGAHCGAM